jgi:hypothetical protein
MGKASSAKKVARAARAGGSRRVGRQRNIGFPIIVAVIVILGTLLVGYARSHREAEARPRIYNGTTGDHWHAAYGIYLCDHFLDAQPQEAQDTLGIHTHGEGIIHIHPFLSSSAGLNATLGVFLEDVNVTVSNTKISDPAGDSVDESKDKCDGKKAIVQVGVWKHAEDATAGKKPTEVFTDDFSKIRFTNDRMAITIAFLPDNATIPPPESIPALDQLTDVGAAASTSSTDTGPTSSTAPGDSSTSSTAPGDSSTSSSPPTSDTTSSTSG